MITFVIYYIHLSEAMIKQVQAAQHYFTHKIPYRIENPERIIQTVEKSIKAFHPDSRLVILTDEKTQLNLSSQIKIARITRNTNFLDLEILKAKIKFLKKYPLKENLIFLDWDVLIQDNLEDIFKKDGDLFFTYRNLFPTPFNDGFIAVRQTGIKKTCEFFEMLMNYYDHFSRNQFKYKNGLKLILKKLFFEAFQKIKPAKIEHVQLDYKGLKIQFLDGNIYNYNPIKKRVTSIYEEKKVIHFSKEKKIDILGYWKLFDQKQQQKPSTKP